MDQETNVKRYLLVFPELCTGCNRCVYACSAEKVGMFKPSLARIHVNNLPLNGFSAPSVCFQCPNPDCMKACREEAIYRDASNVVLVNPDRCTGCGDCVDACPYGMIELDENNMAYKCDYCGGDPACVRECEPQALLFAEPDKEQRKQRAVHMKQRSDSGNPEQKRARMGHALFSLRPKGPAPLEK
jgi:Fe-S-cluster-containing dehydrogenase component